MTVGVSGSATPEEVAAVLAVLAVVRRPQQLAPYEHWRSVRMRTLAESGGDGAQGRRSSGD